MERLTNPPVLDEVKKPFIRMPYNRHLHVRRYERNTMASETIPDQTMSIGEILRRHASGMPFTGPKMSFYEGTDEDLSTDDYMPDLRHMDLADAQAYREMAQDELNQIRKDAKENSDRIKADKAAWAKAQKAKSASSEVEDLDHEDIADHKPSKKPKKSTE